MKFLEKDSDYEALGVEPPVHIVHAGSDSNRPNPHNCKWENKPPGSRFIHCVAGNHGFIFDHLKYRMSGVNAQGEPNLVPIVLSNRTIDKMKKKPETENVTKASTVA